VNAIRISLSFLGVALISLGFQAPTSAASGDDWRALFRGVSKTVAPGTPGPLAVYGPDAFPLLAGRMDGNTQAAIVAGARLGKGRIVAFGHDGFLGNPALGQEGNGELIKNAVSWCAGPGKTPNVAVLQLGDLQAHLSRANISATTIRPGIRDLDRFNVLVVTHNGLTDGFIAMAEAFVRRGGGLLIGSTGWGWAQITSRSIAEHPGSRITAPAGIVWTDLTVAGGGRPVEQTAPPSDLLHARSALAAIRDRNLSAEDMRQAVATCRTTLASLPVAETTFRGEVKSLATASPIPSAAQPVKASAARSYAALALSTAEAATAPVSAIRAHPAAAGFPGAVPTGTPVVTRSLSIAHTQPGWASTGLYAAPGALVRVTLPAAAKGKTWKARIGAHSDTLWHLNSWQRPPAVSREFPVAAGVNEVSNAFGGLIYVDVPEGLAAGDSQVKIEGAVEAPYFQLGQTTPRQWRMSVRSRPAPWAELAGRRVVLTLPSSAIRNLADPKTVVEFWDQVVETQEQLAGQPSRPRLERIVADSQVAYGYMHAGYPISVPTDETMTLALNPAQMRTDGNWGYFHELGHNLQSPDWTFEGTGEVTNNVLALYAYEKVLGRGFDKAHPAIASTQTRAANARKHVAQGSPFAKWKQDPFLALLTYMELKEKWGWAPFEAVFKEFQALPAAERPKTDQDKRDQFVIRFSRAVNTRLDPFFKDRWGIPISPAAITQLQPLKATWRGPE